MPSCRGAQALGVSRIFSAPRSPLSANIMLARHATGPRLGLEPPLAFLCRFQLCGPRDGSGIILLIFVLFAVAAALLLAFVAASARTGSTLVALCEDHTA